MLREYDVVRLTKPILGKGIPVDATGTVLVDHRSTPPAYVVEFTSEDGETIGVVTVTADYLEKVG